MANLRARRIGAMVAANMIGPDTPDDEKRAIIQKAIDTETERRIGGVLKAARRACIARGPEEQRQRLIDLRRELDRASVLAIQAAEREAG